jgi:acyl carrier protein
MAELDEQGEAVLNVLRNQLNEVYRDAPIPLDEDLTGMGLDSLKSVSLLLELENSFGFVFPDELMTAENFRTARNIIGVVTLSLEKAGQGA